jgi:hypothetical protein
MYASGARFGNGSARQDVSVLGTVGQRFARRQNFVSCVFMHRKVKPDSTSGTFCYEAARKSFPPSHSRVHACCHFVHFGKGHWQILGFLRASSLLVDSVTSPVWCLLGLLFN